MEEVYNKFNKCCAEHIRSLWYAHGLGLFGSGYCPSCQHFIGLSATPLEEANEFLAHFGLEPLKEKPKPPPDKEEFDYAKRQLIYALRHYKDRFETDGKHFEEIVKSDANIVAEVAKLLSIIDIIRR